MKIQEAIDFIKILLAKSINQSEKKVYTKFLAILISLSKKEFSDQDLNSVENELDRLNLKEESSNRKKSIKRKLAIFDKYLKTTFSMVSKGYYTSMGVANGMIFGMLVGILFEEQIGISMPIGLVLGMIFGMMVGANMDKKAINQNRVLNTKLDKYNRF